MVDNLKNEAEALRKEKKRSQVSYEKAELLINIHISRTLSFMLIFAF